MEKLPHLRRGLLGLLGSSLIMAFMVALAHSDEVSASCATSGLCIHGPEETLRDYCHEEQGALWLVLPDGTRYELVISTSDPMIANAGDGRFHPFDESVVREALGDVGFPVNGISAQIFLLPYPRKAGLRSAAGRELILLAPGVLPISVEQQHAELIHELGHVIQYALVPEGSERWIRYRELRGITDQTTYADDGPHAARPHEIFAEDFRSLFGDALANYSGSIENASLPMPQSVPGLRGFLAALGGAPMAAGSLAAFPNPSRAAVSFSRPGGEATVLDLYDVRGRRVASLDPIGSASGWRWSWDGRDAHGRELRSSVLFARARGDAHPALRIVRAD